jgi:hypothetical protein
MWMVVTRVRTQALFEDLHVQSGCGSVPCGTEPSADLTAAAGGGTPACAKEPSAVGRAVPCPHRDCTPPANVIDLIDRCHSRCARDWGPALRTVLLVLVGGLLALAVSGMLVGGLFLALNRGIDSSFWIGTGGVSASGLGSYLAVRRCQARKDDRAGGRHSRSRKANEQAAIAAVTDLFDAARDLPVQRPDGMREKAG